MDDVELSRYAAEAFRHMDQGLHPSIEQVAEFATGELSSSARSEIETHLGTCDLCRGRLEEYRRFVADCEQPARRDLSQDWGELSQRIRRRKVLTSATRWGSIAAAVVALVGLSWLVTRMLSPSPGRLLAEAYYEQRSFDIRLAGAQYSTVRRQRGGDSVFSHPAALLKAQAKLAEESRSNPDDPEVLRLKAEAEMMDGHVQAAVETLQRARDLQPQDAGMLADLGAAYALRGDQERQPADYYSALDCLGQSLHLKPHVPEVVFNLALVLEKAQLKDQAIEQWEEYLKLDGKSGWANEAGQYLSALKAAMQSREDALHKIVDDPAQFLAQVSAGSPIDAEAYLRDVAITKWLPIAASGSQAREATTMLAQILRERHGDYWLSDIANSGDGTEMQTGLQKLAAARTGNLHGTDMEAARKSAREARQSFLRAGSQAGNLWARFEEASSLHGLLRHGECVAASEALMRELAAHPYAWLLAQLRIESAICLMRLARLSEASFLLREAKGMGHTSGFGATELRANVQYIDSIGHTGLPSESFSSAHECLRIFWSGAYPALSFQQVVDKLRAITGRSDQQYAACFLARSGARAAQETSDPSVEGPARANLAAAAQAIRQEDEARVNLQLADQLLARIPDGYRLSPEIALARVEIARSEADAALNRLGNLSAHLPSVLVETQYYSVLGEAYRQKGWLPSAINAFRRSIDIGKQRVASLSSEREKAGVLKAIEPGYRGLVEATLGSSGAASALLEWQSFRALDAAGRPPGDVQPPKGLALSFAELHDEYVWWLTGKGQAIHDRLGVSKPALTDLAKRFLRECSDPDGDRRRLRDDAQQLYKWIVAPVATQLTEQDRQLIVEPDGVLTGVPLQALMPADEQYFGDRFSVLISMGYATSRQTARPGGNTSVLVVANPKVTGGHAALFPPLPETLEEAEAIRTAFPASAVLEGVNATVGSFEAHLPSADIVHFAGHGYSNSENGGLLFAPRTPEGEDYQLLGSVDLRGENWSLCRLAVLSACAAAEGEIQGPHNPESLVRALTKAGVSRVLASLWNVDSAATRELMRVFYGSLAQGTGPADALRMAQQSVRQRPGWEHPYYWAGFQLYGTALEGAQDNGR